MRNYGVKFKIEFEQRRKMSEINDREIRNSKYEMQNETAAE